MTQYTMKWNVFEGILNNQKYDQNVLKHDEMKRIHRIFDTFNDETTNLFNFFIKTSQDLMTTN